MKIRRVSGKNFMLCKEFEIEFPDRGLIVISGPNGSGKSTFAEFNAFGLFGKTLRGASPWRSGEAGELTVQTDGVQVTRKSTKGGSQKLEWSESQSDDEGPVYGSSSKAKEPLMELLGSFENWRKCSVFSSSDAALFSMATDKIRKELLEDLLGIDKFDSALKKCREDLSQVGSKYQTLEMEIRHTQVLLEEKKNQLRQASEAIEEWVDLKPVRSTSSKLTTKLDEIRKQQRDVGKQIRHLGSQGAEEKATLRQIQKQLSCIDVGQCPTCGQDVGDDVLDPLKGEVSKIEAQLEKSHLEVTKQIDELETRLDELQTAGDSLDKKISDSKLKQREFEQAKHVKEKFANIIDNAQEEANELSEKINGLASELETISFERLELQYVEKILGMKGVRAHILGKSLDGLECVANSYLNRMTDENATLKLKPYTEKKTGGVSDSISMEIGEYGGGLGYKACSAGQRRRVDLALLLGLAVVSDASKGSSPGMLWFDEVFDALDDQGVQAVSEILHEISKERPVVVISHHPAILGYLDPVAKLRIWTERGSDGFSKIKTQSR